MKKLICLLLIAVLLCSCGKKEYVDKLDISMVNQLEGHYKDRILENGSKVVNMKYIESHVDELKDATEQDMEYLVIKGVVTKLDYEYDDDKEIKYSIYLDDSKNYIYMSSGKDDMINLEKGKEYYFIASPAKYDAQGKTKISIVAFSYFEQ